MKLTTLLTILCGLGVVAILYPVFAPPSHRDPSVPLCFSNVKILGISQLMYASDFDGQFSPRKAWMDLTYPYDKDWQRYHCPQTTGKWGYAYDGALETEKAPDGRSDLPLVYDSSNGAKNASDLVTSLPLRGRHDGKNNVAYADGHAKAVAP